MINKTITVQAFNRPNHLRKCLDHLSRLDGVSEWTVHGIVDGGGDEECRQIMNESDLINYSKFHTMNLGIREANKQTLEYIFEDVGSDWNLHVEEDILVSENSLNLINECFSLGLDTECISLYSYPQLNHESNRVHRANIFSCWAWACTDTYYGKVVKPALEDGQYYYSDSWATSVYDFVTDRKVAQFIPEASHAKNIGISDGVHSNEPNRLDIRDCWIGGQFQKIENYDICEERCLACKTLDGVR